MLSKKGKLQKDTQSTEQCMQILNQAKNDTQYA